MHPASLEFAGADVTDDAPDDAPTAPTTAPHATQPTGSRDAKTSWPD